MEYRQWLSGQLSDLGRTPTDLARVIDGDKLNQPTIQRILSGKTPNLRIGTVAMIEKALSILGSSNPKFDQASEEKTAQIFPSSVTVIKPATERDKWMVDLTELAGQLDLARLGMLVKEARQLVAEMPAKQTPESTG